MNANRIFWILTIAILACLLFPTLLQDGMFLDGITYSAISRNLANGIGSLWDPHYTKVLYPHFYEHPPLVFLLQSYFFKILGDSFITERIFCLFIAIATVIGISQCWKLFYGKTELKDFNWISILLWLSVPLVSWSLKNNLLENTLSLFTIFSVFFILKSLKEQKIIYLCFGSIFIIFAFLSKGFVGIFPLVVPVLYGFIFRDKMNSILYFGYLLFFTFLIATFFVILIPDVKTNLQFYFDQQLLPALKNQREVNTDNRFSIIINLFIELSIPIILLVYFGFRQRKVIEKSDLSIRSNALIFLPIAISASFPLIISLKQSKFYLVPSIPFYTLAISAFLVPILKEKLEKISVGSLNILKIISFGVFAIVTYFSIVNFGKPSRDHDKLRDITIISSILPKGTIISTTKELWNDWSLVAYMCRIGYLSLDCENKYDYLLIESKNLSSEFLNDYEVLDLKLSRYSLLKRKSFN